jgi:replicative DNA helicase
VTTTAFSQILEATLDGVAQSAAARETGDLAGISTGFRGLDALTGGLHPGQLTVLASRPAVGRTTLLSSMLGFSTVRTSAFTLEESSVEFTRRLLAAEGKINLERLTLGSIQSDDTERINRAAPAISSAPLHLHADPTLSMEQITALATADVEQRGARLIAVDGMQDIKPDKRNDLREREVGDVVRGLKTLARELNVPVVATSHLNRGAEQRVDRIPKLDDLRESGAVTFAADLIVLLYRPDMYDECSPRAGEIDLIVAKNRYGRLATVTAAAMLHRGFIANLA